LSGLSANKFSQVITNLCSSSNIKKYSKIVKNAKTQKETNEFEVMNGFQVQNFQEAISKSSDIKLQKINSFNKLAGNGKKSLLDVKHKYTFAIMQGNNHKLLNRIMEQTGRARYWENSINLYAKKSTSVVQPSPAQKQTPKKFLAGNASAH
jgi:hypothetical protein